jgi:hypothetical protein
MFSYEIVISSSRGYYCLGEDVREIPVLLWCFPPVMTGNPVVEIYLPTENKGLEIHFPRDQNSLATGNGKWES